jgi:anhydro-N-acetylmuramic acid kinase
MRVLGLMSGTSADGIDVALARIDGAPPRLCARLENFVTLPFPPRIRRAILRVAGGAAVPAAEISRLNFLLGALFGEAALTACRKFRVVPAQIGLIGSHGQTIHHQGRASHYLGRRVASTLQIGEPAEIAARTGIATVADFRTADMAVGGQGAPLVPFVDFWLYRDARRGRVALNIGGIANLTVIPAGARPGDLKAFDTGPGNMAIDALVGQMTRGHLSFDRGGHIAASGRAIAPVLDRLLAEPYFRRPPPKSAGREQFGASYAMRISRLAGKSRPEDAVATATLLTPLSILDALNRFVFPRVKIDEVIVSGGGAHNPVILAQLEAGLGGRRLRRAEEFGVGEDAKEAFAFAMLAYETWHGRPGNLPSATGARRPAILGKVVHPPRGAR